MSQQKGMKVVGTRSAIYWLLIVVAIVVVAAVAVGGLVIYPQIQEGHEEQARVAEVERHYQAGIAFQNVEDWVAAEAEYRQVITLDANYQDTQARLAEVRTRLAESASVATSTAIAEAERAQTNAAATAAAAPRATADALEASYQKALGYTNMGRWLEAKNELESIFESDPDYKDVQALLAQADEKLRQMTPTSTPVPPATSTPKVTPTPHPLAIKDVKSFPLAGEGTGGKPFTDQSNNASCMVGLSARHKAYVDGIQPIYRRMLADGSLQGRVNGEYHGGTGGEGTILEAPDGWVVVGIKVKTGKYVDQLELIYGRLMYDDNSAKWTIAETRDSLKLGGSGGDYETVQMADDGYCVVGLHGRSGGYLDNVAIIAGKLSD